MITSMVGGASCDFAAATLPTDHTTPGVVALLGNVVVTWSPTFTWDCCVALSATVTMRAVDVAVRTGPPGCAGPPNVADTSVIRIAAGRNTASPRARLPVVVTPRWYWSFLRALTVAAPK